MQNVAARLPRIVGRLEIVAAAHGAWPTTNRPCTHVPTSTRSASWIDARSGLRTLDEAGDRPALLATGRRRSARPPSTCCRSGSRQQGGLHVLDSSTPDAGRQRFRSGAHASARCLVPTPGKLTVASAASPLAAQLDDHALAERRVLDVVADAQPEVVGVGWAPERADRRRGRRRRRARGGRRVALVVGVVASRGGGGTAAGAPQSDAAAGSGGRTTLRPVTLPFDSTSSAGISSRNRDGGLYCVDAEQAAAPGVGDVQPLTGAGDADVGEAALLLQLVGLGRAPGCAGRRPPRRRRGTRPGTRGPWPSAASSARPGRRLAVGRSSVSATSDTCSRNSSIAGELVGPSRPARRGSRCGPADSTVSSASSSAR